MNSHKLNKTYPLNLVTVEKPKVCFETKTRKALLNAVPFDTLDPDLGKTLNANLNSFKENLYFFANDKKSKDVSNFLADIGRMKINGQQGWTSEAILAKELVGEFKQDYGVSCISVYIALKEQLGKNSKSSSLSEDQGTLIKKQLKTLENYYKCLQYLVNHLGFTRSDASLFIAAHSQLPTFENQQLFTSSFGKDTSSFPFSPSWKNAENNIVYDKETASIIFECHLAEIILKRPKENIEIGSFPAGMSRYQAVQKDGKFGYELIDKTVSKAFMSVCQGAILDKNKFFQEYYSLQQDLNSTWRNVLSLWENANNEAIKPLAPVLDAIVKLNLQKQQKLIPAIINLLNTLRWAIIDVDAWDSRIDEEVYKSSEKLKQDLNATGAKELKPLYQALNTFSADYLYTRNYVLLNQVNFKDNIKNKEDIITSKNNLLSLIAKSNSKYSKDNNHKTILASHLIAANRMTHRLTTEGDSFYAGLLKLQENKKQRGRFQTIIDIFLQLHEFLFGKTNEKRSGYSATLFNLKEFASLTVSKNTADNNPTLDKKSNAH